MSCSDCEDEPITGAYIRWENANVEIIACKKHWLEIRDTLVFAQTHNLDIEQTPDDIRRID